MADTRPEPRPITEHCVICEAEPGQRCVSISGNPSHRPHRANGLKSMQVGAIARRQQFLTDAWEMIEDRIDAREVAQTFGMTVRTVYRYLRWAEEGCPEKWPVVDQYLEEVASFTPAQRQAEGHYQDVVWLMKALRPWDEILERVGLSAKQGQTYRSRARQDPDTQVTLKEYDLRYPELTNPDKQRGGRFHG